MASLLGSLEIGKRALNAQRLALTVAGHNLANVNTPNFARQSAEMSASMSGDSLTGVEVTQIRQTRDRVLDERVRQHNQEFARWDTQSKRLSELESLLGDLPGDGLTGALTEFWKGWQDVTTNPESEAARLAVIERGETVAMALKRVHSEFRQMHDNLETEVRNQVTQINGIAESIAKLNGEIIAIEGTGDNANDQRDKREQYLSELSQLINARTISEDNGSIKVLIGGFALVDGVQVSALETRTVSASSSDNHPSFTDASITEISAPGGMELSITGGELAGLIELRDVHIPEITQRLSQLTQSLMDEVNGLHRTGYGLDGTTQLDFFSGDDITDISVNSTLQAHPEKLAAAGVPDAEGDNRIALAIAQKQYDPLFTNGTETFEAFTNSTISLIGTRAQHAKRTAENNELLVQQLTTLQQSLSGVSIDEELSQMIQFQRAYEAAAKYVSTVDELMATLVNM